MIKHHFDVLLVLRRWRALHDMYVSSIKYQNHLARCLLFFIFLGGYDTSFEKYFQKFDRIL